MRRILIFSIFVALLLAVPSFSEETAAGREFYGATVVLIDHDKGMLGIVAPDETTDEQKKFSFQVDPDTLYVADALNRPIDFSDIEQGHQIDIFTEMDPKTGREVVVDIIDRSRLEQS